MKIDIDIDIDIGNQKKWAQDERHWAGLMALAHRGDKGAYNQLLTELGDVIYKYLLVRFGRANWLEDMLQECLLAIHKGRHSYDPKRPFRPWLFALVRNRSIDFLRSQRSSGGRQSIDLSTAAAEASYEENHAVKLDAVRLLARMSPDDREALTLTKYAGFSIAEAAAWSGISKTAMKVRVFRALARTRKQLAREKIAL
ncbi:sigma-70 family RNA polymerase sigma factor [Pseudomaricurvus alcaniphilus]|uniref:sigma-70 family RNA polymerase sigma factor n=1 Tax=Pseudomaricurvus alcaniphilus TaxID=1166482 RepID=UPI00140B286F|nr:sigma-70 family RNA polymerase sigma factor [Pseudomaricurvus alcaniphilus]NHN37496.1 sigma-70 family RNA polymerase sigma factor [Pseudomaricurvus alcaniphilus]